jgi:transcriptional regulator of acetoin/glycerol metabolism
VTLDGDHAAPAIVMVSSGTRPAQLVLPPTAELGRRIAIEGGTHEVPDERMSRDHAIVRWERGTWIIKDLDSRNGTYVGGERALGEVRRRGDVVLRLGHTIFVLLADGRGHGGIPDNPELVVGPELARAHGQIRGHAAARTLLVQGESGSGKQLAAKLWHDAGPRAAGPFVAVACGAIPEGVADRLVFGGKKGAIETIGHYQMARGGTLVLGDLGGLDPTAQARLVKLLGADGEKPGIVATGHELRSVVADGRLREDLYQILARTQVTLPPLRARKVDIARIVQLEVAAAAGGANLAAHAKLIETCCIRAWTGNVRELRSTIKFAALEALAQHKDVVRPDHMPAHAGVSTTISGQTAVERRNPAVKPDRDILIAAIARANGDISIAARGLNMHRDQLKKLLEEYGIVPDEG